MAFALSGLDPAGSGASKGVGTLGLYQTTDAKATVNAASYMNSAFDELGRTKALLIMASDATYFAKVTLSGTTTVTLAALDAFA